MRIGIFTETYTPYISGLVTSELMLKKALEKKGHEVYVVTANLTNFHYDYDEKEKILRIPGIPTGIYDSRLTSIYPIKAINKIKSNFSFFKYLFIAFFNLYCNVIKEIAFSIRETL